MKKFKLFEFIFEGRNEDYEEFKRLGFQPGQHPVITTQNKVLEKIKQNTKAVLSGQNKFLPNYNKKISPEQLLQLVIKGKIELPPTEHTEETEVDIGQAVDKPGLLLDVIKDLVTTGFYTKQEATPALKYLLTNLARIKMDQAQKEKKLNNLSNMEIDRSMNQFFKK